MITVVGNVASPLCSAGEPRDLLQEDHEEEEQDRETAVQREGLQVADREVPAAEQLELQHRLRGVALVGDEREHGEHTADQRHEGRRAAPAVVGLLDQREHDAAEPEDAEDGTRVVDLPARDRQRSRDRDEDQDERRHDDGDVQREDPAPAELVDDQPARERADDAGDRAPGKPAADGRAALLLAERPRR